MAGARRAVEGRGSAIVTAETVRTLATVIIAGAAVVGTLFGLGVWGLLRFVGQVDRLTGHVMQLGDDVSRINTRLAVMEARLTPRPFRSSPMKGEAL